jgi:elongator complex protein 6
MPSQPAVPPLLTPYVTSLPHSSLTVLSSVLDATGNWLVLRFLYAALSAPSNSHVAFGSDGVDGRKKRKVVLVSFLRGWDFWRTEAKRLGLDLARLTEKGQFAFVDGLSELFYAPSAPQQSPAPPSAPSAIPPRSVLPLRTSPGAVPGRAPQPLPRPSSTVSSSASAENGRTKRLHFSGSGFAALDALENDIANVIEQLKTSKDGDEGEPEVLLLIDQPDMLLAATGPNKGIGATEMGEWVMGLQEVRSSRESQLLC